MASPIIVLKNGICPNCNGSEKFYHRVFEGTNVSLQCMNCQHFTNENLCIARWKAIERFQRRDYS